MPQITASKYRVDADWGSAPHLSEEAKAKMLASMEPHLRDARSKGLPVLGVGAVYPVPVEDILVPPFSVPKHYRRAYGLDVGWNRTAAVWGAIDPDTDVLYLYTEHYRGQAEPSVHATAIKARGEWIPGAIDPASAGRGQRDGKQIIADYQSAGLVLTPADNVVEAGVHQVYERLSSGRLKIFTTLANWFQEYRTYHRDENGKIVKQDDHLMDATRYLVMTGLKLATVEKVKRPAARPARGDLHAGL